MKRTIREFLAEYGPQMTLAEFICIPLGLLVFLNTVALLLLSA